MQYQPKTKSMHPIVKNILAVLIGIIVGSFVNGSLISVSGSIIPPPEGADVTTMEGLKAAMHLFEPKHFIFPFLAHALGTLTAAFIAARLAATNKMRIALGIGVCFLVGGAMMVYQLPSPVWFFVLDLVGAYIPMGWLGAKLASRTKQG